MLKLELNLRLNTDLNHFVTNKQINLKFLIKGLFLIV